MATTKTRTRSAGRTRRGETSTREAILERAVDLASTEGLEGLTIGRLAGEMELSKSGLFGHFGSKEELQIATVDAASARFIREVIAPAADTEEGWERLRALCDRYIGHLERNVFSGGCFWSAASAEFDSRPGPVRDAIRDRWGAWLTLLEDQARIAGADDPRQLAYELTALVQGANSAYQLLRDERAFDRARAATARLLA
jgi:AcrR family transcriptional regulator